PGKALFVCLYRRGAFGLVGRDDCYAAPAFRALSDLGHNETRDSFLRFDLERTEVYTEWAGRLVVNWPPSERSWWRWSARNDIGVASIHEHDVLAAVMPEWQRLVLSWTELAVLPRRWRAALAEWRGIYLIFDTRDGKAYVGSASGNDNILGRWQVYATSGHGGNVELKGRDPAGFRFSILERVSPDMAAADVVALEATWKERLHTREFGLNAN
ncbi:MAG: GIY-YIG nuclease family protein, partial [Hyphomicrobium sp.]